MPVRRHADPINVQLVWDSIKWAKHNNQIPDKTTILKFFSEETYYSPTQVELYLSQTLKDGFVIKQESKNPRFQVAHYRIPTNELTVPPEDGKDWYCIECHLAGDVTPCKSCHRVYHIECSRNVRNKQVLFQSIEKHNQSLILSNRFLNLGSSTKDSSNTNNHRILNFTDFVYDQTRCSICNLHRLETVDLQKEDLNHLLKFILDRIRSWLPSNLTHPMAPDQRYPWHDEPELNWRGKLMLHHHVDMKIITSKLQAQEYTKLIEFISDVVAIQHNVGIFHGTDSQEYGAAELMIRDTCHDISELRTCIDCYRHSNEKISNKWFCLPCQTPHKLVWAKQKGYPYWPAKIIKETELNYDVRFFGGKYERSLLPKNKKNILPIETQPKNEIKKTSAFTKALEELKLHQHLLANPDLMKKYITKRAIADRASNKSKTTPTTPNTSSSSTTNTTTSRSKTPTTKKPQRSTLSKSQPTATIEKPNEKPQLDQTENNSAPISARLKRRNTIAARAPTPVKSRRLMSASGKATSTPIRSRLHEIIPISDAEEDELLVVNPARSGDCYGQVSSSTEYFISNDEEFQNHDVSDVMHPLEQPYSDAVEKMRRKLEQTKDKSQLISIAMDCMQNELDRISNEHNDQSRKILDTHQGQISETKKKQWCYNCEQDAIYHCCWNTAYCSPTCQQQHWQAEHKKVCRRKR